MAERNDTAAMSRPGAFVVVGGVAIAVGVAGFVTIGYWYAVDTGMLGNDIMLVVSQTPIVLGLVASAVCVLAGVSMILLRRDVSAASVGGAMLLVTAVALSIAVVVGVRAYPQVEQAELVAHGDVGWRVRLPVTEVHGVLAETDDTITLWGAADRRGCNWVLRSVTIERDTGRIVDVTQLSNFLRPGEEPPPRGQVPQNLEVVRGTTPFICPN